MAGSDAENADVMEPSFPRTISFWRHMTDQGVITQEISNYDYIGSGTQDDPYVVAWIPNDPRNPMQFSLAKKVTITPVTAFATLIVSLTSSAYVGSADDICDQRVPDAKAASHAKMGLDQEKGGVIAMRPNGYVGIVVNLVDSSATVDALNDYFGTFCSRRIGGSRPQL